MKPKTQKATLPAPGKPLLVKSGSVTVKIYQGTNRANGVDYPQFTVVWRDGSTRRKKRFATLAKAKIEAELAAVKLSAGENRVLELTSQDRAVYLHALQSLKPVNRGRDVPLALDTAVREYAEALKRLPEGSTLLEAVEFYRKRTTRQKATVRQVVDELIQAKTQAKLSGVHLKDIESRLNRFAAAFVCDISSVTTPLLQPWLDQMQASGRTKRNYLHVVRSLFRFAIRRKYLGPESMEEVTNVQREKEGTEDISVYSPAEMREILAAARPEMVPFLALAGFAGIRSFEIARLDWRDINLAEGHILVGKDKAKTRARRLVPILGNLAAWLAPHAKPFGPVLPFESWWNQLPKVAEEVNRIRREKAEQSGGKAEKFEWHQNAMRHSFCSYRLAVVKSADQVALEAGNSPQKIFSNYRKLVTEAEAEKWFAILPDHEAKILDIRAAVG